jgi:hypothetical protein
MIKESGESLSNMLRKIEMRFKEDDMPVIPSHSQNIPRINVNLEEGKALPNIGYILSGYNLVNGNPMSSEGLDPGLGINPLFTYNYSVPCTRTSDNRYLLPHGVHGMLTLSCQGIFSSTQSSTADSYEHVLNGHIDVSGGFFGLLSFTLSSEIKRKN